MNKRGSFAESGIDIAKVVGAVLSFIPDPSLGMALIPLGISISEFLLKKLQPTEFFNDTIPKILHSQMHEAINHALKETRKKINIPNYRDLFDKVLLKKYYLNDETLSSEKATSNLIRFLNNKDFHDGNYFSYQDIQDIQVFYKTLCDEILRYPELSNFINREFINSLNEDVQYLKRDVAKLKASSSEQVPDKLLTEPPDPKTTNFIGRKDKIDEITESIKDYKTPLLIHGVGGLGKSELAIKLFREWQEKGVPGSEKIVRFGWIEYKGNIKDSLATSLYYADMFQKTDEKYREAMRYINELGKKLILFIDEFNDPSDEDIKTLTKLTCYAIVTSRTKLKEFKLVDISKLSETECLEIYLFHLLEGKLDEETLKKKTSKENEKIIKQIIKRADYNTFAVERLALTQKNSGKSPKVFHEKLKKEGFNLEGIESVDIDGYNAEFIEHMAKLFSITHLNTAKKHVLQLFSILPYRPLSGELMMSWFGEKNRNNANALVKSGWLIEIERKKSEDKIYQMNQIIAETLRYSTKPKYKDIESMVRIIANDLRVAEKETFSERSTLVEFAKSVANYCITLQEETPIIAMLEHELGNILSKQGSYREAIVWSEKAALIRERELGPGHQDTANTYNITAHIYYLLADYYTALEWYKKIRRVIEYAPWRNDNLFMVIFYDGFARCFFALGEYDAALDYFENALEIVERVLGKKHPDTATTYNNIANVYDSKGEYNEALEWHKKALAIREQVLGKEHPDTATSYNNIANVYQSKGEYDKALDLYEKALAIREQVLGKEHPDTATTYNTI
jgi:tetratricopeptide (TPR) repeat protein